MEAFKNDSINVIDSVHYALTEGDISTQIDTLKVVTEEGDTALVIKEHELQIIERLLDNPDYGGRVVSVLIIVFVAIALIKRWKK